MTLSFETGATRPAEIERGRILLAAFRAFEGRAARGRAKEFVDDRAGAIGIRGVLHPELGERRVDRQFAREARGVRVEDSRANAPGFEQICEEVRLRQVGCGVDALQNR
jgi:hypothetical protein